MGSVATLARAWIAETSVFPKCLHRLATVATHYTRQLAKLTQGYYFGVSA